MGKIFIVGIGPGSIDEMTPRQKMLLCAATISLVILYI